MNANKNLNFSLLKMKKTGDTILWLSTIDLYLNSVCSRSYESVVCMLLAIINMLIIIPCSY